MGGDRQAVKECPAPSCPVYPYRFGTNPERRDKGGKHFQKARVLKKNQQILVFPSDEGQGKGGPPSTRKKRKKDYSRSSSSVLIREKATAN